MHKLLFIDQKIEGPVNISNSDIKYIMIRFVMVSCIAVLSFVFGIYVVGIASSPTSILEYFVHGSGIGFILFGLFTIFFVLGSYHRLDTIDIGQAKILVELSDEFPALRSHITEINKQGRKILIGEYHFFKTWAEQESEREVMDSLNSIR